MTIYILRDEDDKYILAAFTTKEEAKRFLEINHLSSAFNEIIEVTVQEKAKEL